MATCQLTIGRDDQLKMAKHVFDNLCFYQLLVLEAGKHDFSLWFSKCCRAETGYGG